VNVCPYRGYFLRAKVLINKLMSYCVQFAIQYFDIYIDRQLALIMIDISYYYKIQITMLHPTQLKVIFNTLLVNDMENHVNIKNYRVLFLRLVYLSILNS